ncbi:hypothetical protein ACRS7F_25185 [Brucella anthropi]|jgi:hypothetical protein|uniref:hypothetical protein n=1 Tax=Brucella anthropi TaxID=529 RepID=UPI000E88C4BE|nr:hypothetical protein HGK82_23395 [Ochrobactrum sp. MT180101]HBQ33532.1 hypothetical protein [Brucella anthropi]
MQSLFSTPVDFQTVLNRALMCDDELDRSIEIKQFHDGKLSPCFVKLDAAGLGVASRVKLVEPIIEAFVRPRIMLDGDEGLCFCFSVNEQCSSRTTLEDCARQFSRVLHRSALVIETYGRFAGRALTLALLFDRESKHLAREWAEGNFDVRLLMLDPAVEGEEEHETPDEDAA